MPGSGCDLSEGARSRDHPGREIGGRGRMIHCPAGASAGCCRKGPHQRRHAPLHGRTFRNEMSREWPNCTPSAMAWVGLSTCSSLPDPLSSKLRFDCRATGQRLIRRTGIVEQSARCRLAAQGSRLRCTFVQRSVVKQGDTRLQPRSEAAHHPSQIRQAPVQTREPLMWRHCFAMHCRTVIEIMFGRLKDWRRVATRHCRCPKDSPRPSRSRQP